jgi:hypothetical protein
MQIRSIGAFFLSFLKSTFENYVPKRRANSKACMLSPIMMLIVIFLQFLEESSNMRACI